MLHPSLLYKHFGAQLALRGAAGTSGRSWHFGAQLALRGAAGTPGRSWHSGAQLALRAAAGGWQIRAKDDGAAEVFARLEPIRKPIRSWMSAKCRSGIRQESRRFPLRAESLQGFRY
jgi:hypothetical protein